MAARKKPLTKPVGRPWRPGQSGNPAGRPVGSRNKLADLFITDVYETWVAAGRDAIERVLKDQPSQYLKIVASLMPKEFHVKDPVFDAMNDEQLADLIGEVRAARAAAAARAKAAGGTQLTDRVH